MKTKHLRLMQRAYIVLFFCFMYLPIAYMIVFSFNQSKGYALFTGFTLKWYSSLFHNASILNALWVSIEVAILSAIIATVLGTAASLGIASMGRGCADPASAAGERGEGGHRPRCRAGRRNGGREDGHGPNRPVCRRGGAQKFLVCGLLARREAPLYHYSAAGRPDNACPFQRGGFCRRLRRAEDGGGLNAFLLAFWQGV